jgi:hypothetical protein
MSREHVISKSALPISGITVYGLPGFTDKPRSISINSLTHRNLCETHNSTLSNCDTEAGRLANAFDDASRLTHARERVRKTYWNVVRYRIDGPLLERWFLKTLINLGQIHRAGRKGEDIGFALPLEQLARIAFGDESLPGRAGLYGAAFAGMQTPRDKLGTYTVLNKERQVVLGFFSFWGFRFILSLLDSGVPSRLPAPKEIIAEGWSGSEPLYHLREIRETVHSRLRHVIHFDWPADTRH